MPATATAKSEVTKLEQGASVYHIRQGWEWGVIVLRCVEQKALVIAHSTFGTYGHFWSSCGTDPVQFLKGLDREYTMQKLTDGHVWELDTDALPREAAEAIIEARCAGALTKEEARELYDAVGVAAQDWEGEELQRYLVEHRLGSKVWDVPPSPRRMRSDVAQFWETIWLPFVAAL